MILYLIRHAIAEEHPTPATLGDDGRVLTAAGREKFALQVVGLRQLATTFELVAHSPKLRAVETAQLLEPVARKIQEQPLLGQPPGTDLLEWLAQQSLSPLALVGHQPWLSQLCAHLLTGRADLAHLFAFKKGGMAVLEGTPTPGQMQLTALLPPRVLRVTAKSLPPGL